MKILKPATAIAGAGVVGVGVLVPSVVSADSGVLSANGGQCQGYWRSGDDTFGIRDNAGGADDDYCYINYGGNPSVTKRVEHPEDCCIGQWRYYKADMTGISEMWLQVCEERQNDPDLCSSVHGPYGI